MPRALLLLVLAACTAASEPEISYVRPAFSALSGGRTVEIGGAGFDPVENRVFIGGREAPLVRTLDEQHLEVIVPPGAAPGASELLVLAGPHTIVARAAFRYSSPPEITDIAPSSVSLATPTTIHVTGSGFVAEAAGEPTVLVDGVRIPVTVHDDTRLSFTAPPGRAFAAVDLALSNARGSAARATAYRYRIADRPGLLTLSNFDAVFGYWIDPLTLDSVGIELVGGERSCFYAVTTDALGDLWASDACGAAGWRWGRLDLAAQKLVDARATQHLYMGITLHHGEHYAIRYGGGPTQLGRLDVASDTFTPIAQLSLPCCSMGLASDGVTLWIAAGEQLSTVDATTGELGPPLTVGIGLTDLRMFGDALYATTIGGSLVRVDRSTGAVDTLNFVGQSYALELVP